MELISNWYCWLTVYRVSASWWTTLNLHIFFLVIISLTIAHGSKWGYSSWFLSKNEFELTLKLAPVAVQPWRGVKEPGIVGVKDSLQSHLSWGCLSTPDHHLFSIRVISKVALEPEFIWQPTSVSLVTHSTHPILAEENDLALFSPHATLRLSDRRHYLQAKEFLSLFEIFPMSCLLSFFLRTKIRK